jgi:hypothetical protein
MSASYDYLAYELDRGREAWAEFSAHVRGAGALAGEEVELVGLFAPQLGFASNEAIVLIRSREPRELPPALASAPSAVRLTRDRLTPTVRPEDHQLLKQGGIYVHRWFTIDGDRIADFVDLSNRAWGGFEGTYRTEIFGLFIAEPNKTDLADGAARMLLLTWYADHAVWEASREQARDAASLFAQRHKLTRTTIGKSSLLVA